MFHAYGKLIVKDCSSPANPLGDLPALPARQRGSMSLTNPGFLLFPGPNNNQEDKHWNIEPPHFEIHHSVFDILRLQNIYGAWNPFHLLSDAIRPL
jgi:hypothetical protein